MLFGIELDRLLFLTPFFANPILPHQRVEERASERNRKRNSTRDAKERAQTQKA